MIKILNKFIIVYLSIKNKLPIIIGKIFTKSNLNIFIVKHEFMHYFEFNIVSIINIFITIVLFIIIIRNVTVLMGVVLIVIVI